MNKSGREEAVTAANLLDYWSKLEHVTPAELRAAILYTQANHAPILTRWLIQHFGERMRDGERYDEDSLRLMLTPVFSQMMMDEKLTADQAFGLTLRKGRYSRQRTEDRDIQATALVLTEVRKGVKWLAAVTSVAELLPMSEGAIARAYGVYAPLISRCSDEILTRLATANSNPLPPDKPSSPTPKSP